jgi:3-dehydroquinate synthase
LVNDDRHDPAEVIEISVGLENSPYSVWIGDGILDSIGERLGAWRRGKKVALVTDANVAPLYADRVLSSLTAAGFSPCLIVVPAGESSKCLAGVEMICDAMISAGLDRSSSLVALGGGVIGDLAGFAAAVYYRGIPYVQVPTTVVAQVDSAVGGKTGVNATGGKNLIGAFHQPAMVFCDPFTLSTLPTREFNEGIAEVIKHAAIRMPSLLDELDPNQRTGLAPMIAKNVSIKAEIVAADEFETIGLRAMLNFGHTLGHAIENVAGYGTLLHGEAISIGLHAALKLSAQFEGMPDADANRVLDALRAFHLPLQIPAGLQSARIFDAMMKDKKFASGSMRFVLLRALGKPVISSDVTPDAVRDVIASLQTA